MANLSNINNILRTSSLGVGINCDAEFSLDIEKASANAILSLNSNGGSGAEYLLSSTTSGEFVLNKRYVGDRLTISSGGDATFAGTVQVNGSNVTVINASDPNITVSDTDTNYRGSMRWLTSSNVLEFFTRYAGTYYTNNLVLDRGNVGIGTTSPTGKFNSYISATRQLTHNGNGGDLSIISDNNNSPVMFIKGTGSADLLNVFDNTTEVFTILDGGNVGIGTDSPNNKLQVVAGNAQVQAWFGETSYTDSAIRIGGANGAGGRLFVQYVGDNSYIDCYGGHGSTERYRDLSLIARNLIFKTASAASPSEAMRIDSSGNVGIGRTAPDYKLVISNGNAEGIELGPGYASGNNLWQNYNRTTSAYVKETHYASTYAFLTAGGNTGNVGIGTDSPGKLLSVIGADGRNVTTYLAEIVNNDNTSDQGHGLLVGGGNNANHHLFQVNASGSAVFAIKGNGNVGIGTTSPLALLNIEGPNNQDGNDYAQLYIKGTGTYPDDIAGIVLDSAGSNQSHIRFHNNGTPKFQIRYNSGNVSDDKLFFYSFTQSSDMVTMDGATGNVGIGTNSPLQKLHLAESGATSVQLEFSNTSLTKNSYLGINGSGHLSLQTNELITFNTGSSYTERMHITSGGEF